MTNPVPVAIVQLTLDRGSDYVQTFTWTYGAALPVDMSTANVRMVFHTPSGLTIQVGSGVVIAANSFTATVTKAQQSAVQLGNYSYDCFVDFASGVTAHFLGGGASFL